MDQAVQVPSERERWEAECAFRDRELLVSEAESDIKRQELDLKRIELTRSRFANPLFIAVLAAAIAAAGNAIVSYTDGRSERDLEDRKSEQARIQEMIKTGDPDTAARNLKFLVDSGLIADAKTVKALNAYLRNRKPGSGAALPAASGVVAGGIFGTDDTVPLDAIPSSTPISNVAAAVGRIRQYQGDRMRSQCTAAHIGRGSVIVPGFCVTSEQSEYRFVLRQGAQERLMPAILAARPASDGGNRAYSFAVFEVEALRDSPFALKFASEPAKTGDPLSMILFRIDDARVISNVEDCRVIAVEQVTVSHRCDTGAGSAGAPLLNAANEVVALHLMTGNETTPAKALRADWIVARLRGTPRE